jgi:enoyl-CoA hydratase
MLLTLRAFCIQMSTPRDSTLPLGVSSHRHPDGPVLTIVLHRPAQRNAVDGPTARALYKAFVDAEEDSSVNAIVLYGAGGTFCAGADLTALSRTAADGRDVSSFDPSTSASNPLTPVQPLRSNEDPHRVSVTAHTSDIGPMGISRLQLTKPVIAAIASHAVAGGLELACWADMRVAEEGATFGVFCRRFGVPLIDGGTVRLPRLIGQSRAMDMILTGRPVDAQEALQMGLANRVVARGMARTAAEEIALQLAAFPQRCLRADRWSAIQQHGKPERLALEHESAHALDIVREESVAGATRFARGQGRHGTFASTSASSHHTVAAASSSSAAVAPAVSTAACAAPSIRCVLFDLGGVVVDSPVGVILEYERSLGLPRHALNILLGRSRHFHALERGEISLEQFEPLLDAEVAERAQKMGMNLGASAAGVTKRFSSHDLFALMGSVAPRRAMLASIARLRQRGILVGAVTNNWKDRLTDSRGCMMTTTRTMLADSANNSSSSGSDSLDSVFDFIIESCVVGVRKPDRRIFEVALARAQELLLSRPPSAAAPLPLRLRPAEVVFLDDLGGNLKAARQLGVHTIKVTTAFGRALKQLADLTRVQLDLSEAPMEEAAQQPEAGADSEEAAGGSAGPDFLRAKL